MNIIQKPIINFTKGREIYKPEAIVIHIMDGSLSGTDEWFATGSKAAGNPVSSHYGIGKNGEIHKYVAEADQSWHAGRVARPVWKLIKKNLDGTFINPNKYTIGIEHEGRPLTNDIWPEAMKQSSAELIADICKRYNLPIDRDHVIGHYEIFADKPNCPGVNHGILDELVARAKAINTPVAPAPVVDKTKEKIAQAIALHEQAITILKSI